MSRTNDIQILAAVDPAPVGLPIINWASIGHTAPVPLAIPARQPSDPLPGADIVVITWTNAEWSALDHVFLNGAQVRSNSDHSWAPAWKAYQRGVGAYTSDDRSEPLWGSFRLVQVSGATRPWKVLLFHSNAHLQYEPYIDGLRAMVSAILTDAQPRYLYSIGTAGGANLQQNLGDPVVTNGATLQVGKGPNTSDPADGRTFSCATWSPPTALFPAAQALMLPLANVVNMAELQFVFTKFSERYDVGTLTLADLLNAPLQPANLGTPTVHNMPGVPLNTSCDFGMAPGAGTAVFSAYEEDDAAVGEQAGLMNVDYAFIRNVSDTVVPDHTAAGPIDVVLRQNWATALYDRYGLLTALNGALATWAAIAAS